MSKYAILIGCNYAKTDSELSGCIPDVLAMQKYLLGHGYPKENIILSTDDPKITPKMNFPTKANITRFIKETLAKLLPGSGSRLFWHMSSHGGYEKEVGPVFDEKDHKDECVYDCNLESITDDYLKAVLINKIPVGCSLRAVMDNCFSGTNMDLPFLYKNASKYITESTECAKSSDILCISGCSDTQTSADTVNENGIPCGALTNTVLRILNMEHAGLIWSEFLAIVKYVLKLEGYDQTPQLGLGAKGLQKKLVNI